MNSSAGFCLICGQAGLDPEDFDEPYGSDEYERRFAHEICKSNLNLMTCGICHRPFYAKACDKSHDQIWQRIRAAR